MRFAALKSVPKFVVFVSILTIAVGITPLYTSAQSSDSASSSINAQLCSGGLHAPSGGITSPASGTFVGEPSQQLVVRTSWVYSYKVYSGNNLLVANNSVSYAANVTSTATVTLPEGKTTLHLVMEGGCPQTSADSSSITLTYSVDSATIRSIETNNRSPRLHGFVSRSDATILVRLQGRSYSATNNGDGTWTLPAGTITPDLPDGSYDVRVMATVGGDTVSNTLTRNAVHIDTIAPRASLVIDSSDSRSPELSGTVNDSQANIVIAINGHTYPAKNNGDGTWTLVAGVIRPLASGTYDVTVNVTDAADNTAVYTYQLTIKATDELGFILSPNTGFLRVSGFSVPSWVLYIITAVATIVLLMVAKICFQKRLVSQQPTNN